MNCMISAKYPKQKKFFVISTFLNTIYPKNINEIYQMKTLDLYIYKSRKLTELIKLNIRK